MIRKGKKIMYPTMKIFFKDVRHTKSYTQNFLKVHYIIIQAKLGRKLIKKITRTGEKIFRVYKAFGRKK